jgi:hypothetical protein
MVYRKWWTEFVKNRIMTEDLMKMVSVTNTAGILLV